jgi:TolB protein
MDRSRAYPACRAAALVLLALTAGACGTSPAEKHRVRGPIALASLRGHIVYSHGGDVWVARADGTHARRVTHRRGDEFDPSWSPDGNRIAYRDSRRGINRNDEIYVAGADGAHARDVTRTPYNEWSPSWSPDGRLIAFYSGQLFVMRPDGTHARAVSSVEGEYPAWSPDGRRIAFMSAQPDARGSDPDYDVVVVNRDGSGLRRLTDWPREDGWPAWSPDGRSIAFTSTHGAAGRQRLWVMAADGSHKRLLAPGAFPVWAPDGSVILFSEGDRLRVIRPDGSGLRELPIRGWLADWHG